MGYVYIVSNKHNTVFYTGVTNDIERRAGEHKAGVGSIFTSKFKCNVLIYFEQYMTMGEAIAREKLLKRWKRDWKLDLIKTDNPDMLDLAADWFNQEQLDAIIAEYKNRRQEP
jgi:putative endonuclease